MPRLDQERRRAMRYRLAVPVQVKGRTIGRTLDMSTDGISFETRRSYKLGENISFSVILTDSRVQCEGRVVRVERQEDTLRIAVEFEGFNFSSIR